MTNDWFRIFDKDGDGYVSKKEFKWMTANKRISQRKVDIMFEVRSVGGPAFILCLTRNVYCRDATWIRMGGWTTRNLKCWFSATEREKNLPGVKIKPCRDGKVARYQNSKNKIYHQLDVLFILETLKYIFEHKETILQLQNWAKPSLSLRENVAWVNKEKSLPSIISYIISI